MQFLATESHMSRQIDIKAEESTTPADESPTLGYPKRHSPPFHVVNWAASSLLLDLLEQATTTKLILFFLLEDKSHTFLVT